MLRYRMNSVSCEFNHTARQKLRKRICTDDDDDAGHGYGTSVSCACNYDRSEVVPASKTKSAQVRNSSCSQGSEGSGRRSEDGGLISVV